MNESDYDYDYDDEYRPWAKPYVCPDCGFEGYSCEDCGYHWHGCDGEED